MPRISATNLLELAVPVLSEGAVLSVDASAIDRLRQSMGLLAAEFEGRRRRAFTGVDVSQGLVSVGDVASEARAAQHLVDRWQDTLSVAQLTYPYPLARALRTYEIAKASEDARAENDAILHTFETSLILAACLTGSYSLFRVSKLDSSWVGQFHGSGVTLGGWRKLAFSAFSAEDDPRSLAGIASCCLTGSSFEKLVAELLSWRNDRAHGSGPRTKSDFLRSNAELRPKLYELVVELRPLSRMAWWIADGLDWIPQKGRFAVHARDLRGDHPEFIPFVAFRVQPIARGQVMVTVGDLEFSLDAFLRYMTCEVCGGEEFFYPDSRDRFSGVTAYRSLDRGHKNTEPISLGSPLLRRALGIQEDDAGW
jgi:hypothetical protein